MSVRIPIVLGEDGEFEQLQPGDNINVPQFDPAALPGPFGFYFQAENMGLDYVPAGGAVSFHPSGFGIILAMAALAGRACVGLSRTPIFTANPGYIQTAGLFRLADWTPIVGTVTLVAKAKYFLDPVNPGKLTLVPPTTPGQVLQCVGGTVFPDTMEIRLGNPILL